jgi:hypothetical protein
MVVGLVFFILSACSEPLVIVTASHVHNNGFSIDWMRRQWSRLVDAHLLHWDIVWVINFDGMTRESPQGQSVAEWLNESGAQYSLLLNGTSAIDARVVRFASLHVVASLTPVVILSFSERELVCPQGSLHNRVHQVFAHYWVYHMDADNMPHCDFFRRTAALAVSNVNLSLVLFGQKRYDGLNFMTPWNPRVNYIDLAQCLMRVDEIIRFNILWPPEHCMIGDGYFIQKAFQSLHAKPGTVHATNEILSYHNRLLQTSLNIEECAETVGEVFTMKRVRFRAR